MSEIKNFGWYAFAGYRESEVDFLEHLSYVLSKKGYITSDVYEYDHDDQGALYMLEVKITDDILNNYKEVFDSILKKAKKEFKKL